MRKLNGNILFAAHDLDRFLACSHATFLDLCDLEEPLPKSEDDEQLRLFREKGFEHERKWLDIFRQQGISVVEVQGKQSLGERVEATKEAMIKGADIIYQAALHTGNWRGYADFLRKTKNSGSDRPVYEVLDTKLSRTATPAHIMQLCVYSEMLTETQGLTPAFMYLILGDNRKAAFRFDDFAHYFRIARRRFEDFVSRPPLKPYPEPCRACERCRWRDICAEQWEKDDHLSLVAGIQRTQVEKFQAAGVSTVRALAGLPQEAVIPKLSNETFARLRSQARLQAHKRDTGENKVEILPVHECRGFRRLPKPDPGDLFLDFEGDPLYPDGLEYLMGLYFVDAGTPVFKPFWGHDHDAERASFEQLMDFIESHLRLHPGAHIYHYNHYEETAIKRLASGFGTREGFVDDLLRGRRLVDLYKVVREGLRISELHYRLPSKSLLTTPNL